MLFLQPDLLQDFEVLGEAGRGAQGRVLVAERLKASPRRPPRPWRNVTELVDPPSRVAIKVSPRRIQSRPNMLSQPNVAAEREVSIARYLRGRMEESGIHPNILLLLEDNLDNEDSRYIRMRSHSVRAQTLMLSSEAAYRFYSAGTLWSQHGASGMIDAKSIQGFVQDGLRALHVRCCVDHSARS